MYNQWPEPPLYTTVLPRYFSLYVPYGKIFGTAQRHHEQLLSASMNFTSRSSQQVISGLPEYILLVYQHSNIVSPQHLVSGKGVS